MNPKLKTFLNDNNFPGEDISQIESFLDRGFSMNGQTVIVSIFFFAKEAGISVTDALIECEKEWKRNWQYQHPDIKGDVDAPGGAGRQNKVSLENIYKSLGIPSPLEQAK